MAEEFQNYQEMLDEVHQWATHHDEPVAKRLEGVITADDLGLVEQSLREGMELLLMRFEELHARVWAMEERLKQLEEGSKSRDQGSR